MLKQLFLVAAALSLTVLGANPWPAHGTTPPEPSLSVQSTGTNLLANGDFDQGGFYWRPTNHFVGDKWYEWWVGGEIPEFIDGGHPYHNSCYPMPASGVCADANNHSQGYIRWGAPFVAGVYQPVPAVACASYRFEAYNRNDAWSYHPKVGIDPTGWRPTELHGAPPDNCPPDGQTPCPNPSLNSSNPFPSTMIWSPEFDHTPYTWASQSVTAEARTSTITVWTYVAPTNPGSMSAYWDYASLVQIPPANGKLIANGPLPAADGSITNVTTQTAAIRATLSWKTSQPALTQVLYHYVGDANMPSPPPIENQVANYEASTSIDYTAATNHQARLPNLRPMSLYDYVILARRVVGSSCQTAVLTGRVSTTDTLLADGPLPDSSGIVAGPHIISFSDVAFVIWQSSQPSYGQVLYHHVVTPTLYPNRVYLPLVFRSGGGNGSTSDYELRTPPDLMLSTLHVITVTSHLTPNERYTAVAVSAWSEGDTDKATASAPIAFNTTSTTLVAPSAHSGQLVEQLQACLAEGKRLDVCVGEWKQK